MNEDRVDAMKDELKSIEENVFGKYVSVKMLDVANSKTKKKPGECEWLKSNLCNVSSEV